MTVLEGIQGNCGVGELYNLKITTGLINTAAYRKQNSEQLAVFVALENSDDSDDPDDCNCDCAKCKECEKRDQYTPNYAVIIFSDVVGGRTPSPGESFAAYIRGKRWGTLTQSAPATNPSSESKIVVWTWVPNKAFHKYASKL